MHEIFLEKVVATCEYDVCTVESQVAAWRDIL